MLAASAALRNCGPEAILPLIHVWPCSQHSILSCLHLPWPHSTHFQTKCLISGSLGYSWRNQTFPGRANLLRYITSIIRCPGPSLPFYKDGYWNESTFPPMFPGPPALTFSWVSIDFLTGLSASSYPPQLEMSSDCLSCLKSSNHRHTHTVWIYCLLASLDTDAFSLSVYCTNPLAHFLYSYESPTHKGLIVLSSLPRLCQVE